MNARTAGAIGSDAAAVAAVVAAGIVLARASSTAHRTWFALAFALVVLGAAVAAHRRAMLVAVAGAVVLATVPIPLVKQSVFYPRFVLLAALSVMNLRVVGRLTLPRTLSLFSAPLVLLCLLAMISSLWSSVPSLSFQRGLGMALLVGAVVTTALVWRSRPTTMAGDIAAVAAVLAVVLCVSAIAALGGQSWAYSGQRLRGILENPNTLGLAGGFFVPLAIGLAAATSKRAIAGLWLVCVVVAVWMVILSGSRGGAVAGGMGVIVFFASQRPGSRVRRAALLSVLVAVTAGLLAFGPAGLRPPTTVVEHLARRGTSGRFEAWAVAGQLASERPFAGWGFGTTEQQFGQRVRSLRLSFQGALIHNGYLQILVELGPIGLTLAVLPLATAIVVGMRPIHVPLSGGVFGTLIAGALSQLVESGLTAPGSIWAFNLWFAAAATVHFADHLSSPASALA